MPTDPYLPIREEFRVNDAQHVAMSRAASEADMTLAAWLRMVTGIAAAGGRRDG